MKFCERCGSYMEKTKEGFQCPRCGDLEPFTVIEFNKRREETDNTIYVVDKSLGGYIKVNHECPQCGNHEAYRLIAMSSGEHAGVKQDRAVEHYKCTRCFHSWIES